MDRTVRWSHAAAGRGHSPAPRRRAHRGVLAPREALDGCGDRRALLDGPARFGEIARAIPGITESVLSTRLSELKDAGLVERDIIDGPPIASVYRLTPSGEALRPALNALCEWASAHLPPQPAP